MCECRAKCSLKDNTYYTYKKTKLKYTKFYKLYKIYQYRKNINLNKKDATYINTTLTIKISSKFLNK